MDAKTRFLLRFDAAKAEIERDIADAARLPVFELFGPVAILAGIVAGMVGMAGGLFVSMACSVVAYGLFMLPALLVKGLVHCVPGPFARLARRLGYASSTDATV